MAGKLNGQAKAEFVKRYILLADTQVDVAGKVMTLGDAVGLAAELGGYRDSNAGMAIWAITRCAELLLEVKATEGNTQGHVPDKAKARDKAKVEA